MPLARMAVGSALSRERHGREVTAVAVLAGISISHLLNDTIQSLVPANYPMLKDTFALNFRRERRQRRRRARRSGRPRCRHCCPCTVWLPERSSLRIFRN